MSLAESIRYNLKRLMHVSGRETSDRFWPYAIAVFILWMGSCIAAMMVSTAGMIMRAERARLSGAAEDQLLKELQSGASFGQVTFLAAASLIAVLLLSAAVARRLHDRDRSASWGLLPIPFMIGGLAGAPRGFEVAAGGGDLSGIEWLPFLAAPLFWLAFGLLAFLLAGDGTPAPNRFGPPGQ